MPRVSSEFKSLPRNYAALVRELAPRPIHTDSEYDEVVEMIDALAGHKLNKDQEDYLEALSRFVEDYDQQHHEIPVASPIQVLKHLMAQRNMTGYQLGMLLGDPSLGSKLLTGRRALSKAHIKKLTT